MKKKGRKNEKEARKFENRCFLFGDAEIRLKS